jgi:hypothetical protein
MSTGVNIDKLFIKENIINYGVINGILLVEKIFGNDMNKSISDETLRIMVWQISHSLNKLISHTHKQYSDLDDIRKEIKDNSAPTTIIAKHLINILDGIELYVSQ